MRREGVSYQEMFHGFKNTLGAERKVVRASGWDTGDQMRFSRDKIIDLSHKLMTALRVNRAARQRIRSQRREIPEGSEEWELLHRRYHAKELKKFGIDLSR